MIKRKLTEADWFLIVANLLPVYGVWYLNWNVKEIFLVYCLETIIIGFFTLVKLGIATIVRKKDWWEAYESRSMVSGVFFMFFFLVHYGFFVAIQTTIFLTISSFSHDNANILQIIFHPRNYLSGSSWLLLFIFIFGYGYESLIGFIINKEYHTKSFARIMFEPYIRIFVQQFTVIIGSFVLLFGSGNIFIFLFAFIKIFFTVFINYNAALEKADKKNALFQESKSSHS